ncbi:BcsR/BcsP family cellulose biosynthesis protein [Cupriavidus lacunae]|uniref:BcsR/BcsP family cellulose biosynthesis protein n=1 Tax=Cupriavidus lacunae TaxID=2666307 RepID=UPI003CC56AEE
MDVLGNEVDGFEPQHYFDQQELQAARAAARRWPLLASLLGYGATGSETGGPGGPVA